MIQEMRDLSNKIKFLRARDGLTVEELSKKASVTEVVIVQIEECAISDLNLDENVVWRLAKAFEVFVVELTHSQLTISPRIVPEPITHYVPVAIDENPTWPFVICCTLGSAVLIGICLLAVVKIGCLA